ncbi:uncharacterized protein naa80 [Clarias gariepinus]|uniref:N-alpha-acetyltransferase 80 isoform X2 n=1 Tax=Clarias gariepinus TaxID=13013 RepID=UPI00234E099E|nr:N-alpha-acetyltransferase 80 isoform X2 [Clarias gariepinus]
MCEGDVRASAVRLVPLHKRWDLLEACADLLNAQWKRSIGARLHSLRQSSDSYPTCLVLLEGETLVGHARVSRVLGSRSACVESVVVLEALRGRGYGRVLMEEVERYARNRGFTRLCLTTHDKQYFYAHLGFVLSRPVQNISTLGSLLPMDVLHKFCRTAESEDGEKNMKDNTVIPNGNHPPPKTSSPPLSPTSPPPNPVPLTFPFLPCSLSPPSFSAVLPPPLPSPPPLPPPPPPPSPSCSSSSSHPPPAPALPSSASSAWVPVEQTLEQTPYTDCRGLPIFWMHKNI